jgi:hypothetical protein
MSGWVEGSPSPEEVAALGADRLAEILVDHAFHDPRLEQALRLALAAQVSHADLARILAGEVDAMSARRNRWSDGDDQDLAHGIGRVRAAITRDLLSRAPRAAADLHTRLIRLHPAIIAQVRDSDGVVGSAIEAAVADLGVACAALPASDRRKLPAEVAALLLADDYGVCRRLIYACKDALGPEGLAELDQLFRAGLDGIGRAGGAQHRRTWLGGRAAWAVAGDDAAAEDFAREQVQAMLGAVRLGAGAVVTGWGTDPVARGAYAYARPGHAGARAALADAFPGERLLFAGEATRTDGLAGTVGGAWLSGRDAAARLLQGGIDPSR